MGGAGGNSALTLHTTGEVGEGRDTQEHTQERTRKCCTYPLAAQRTNSTRFFRLESKKLLEAWGGQRKAKNSAKNAAKSRVPQKRV